ncbi:MAG: protein disulfide oxidoreductase [gamma proteobacterium symbiont of Lucinoma myriamae]|nr:protein disulfide oxidoreductase [gamma proteobacterium symbiont of Lucinoma myriamae]MCU7818061.1 protein disulfide oxidoreductase [gamma proteobacterium symbiont of Lucinoma myriamae]MCU7832594.1 protein disulfide oxidoreductase [gamma proteobacterium symbiont of Lucinoma myriamae]
MLKRLKTKQFWIRIARDGIILIAILYLFNLYQTRNMPDIAPALYAQLISGESVELSQMIKGSPVLIYFWGSWCPICSYTSSTVTELSREYQVITIALSSGSEEQVFSYLKKNKYYFPVINDPDGIISQKWGVFVIPSFFIINSHGEISSVTTGISSVWGLRFRLWLAS